MALANSADAPIDTESRGVAEFPVCDGISMEAGVPAAPSKLLKVADSRSLGLR
jgi:hypothetical protein